MSEAMDLTALREAVGKTHHVSDELSPFPARALAAALDHEHLPEAGEPLPLMYHWLHFAETPRGAETRGDGHPRSPVGGLLPAALPPRRMWASGDVQLDRPLILGQRAEKTSTVKSIDHKTGKSGDLVFATLEHVFTQGGHVCIREEQVVVYRPMPEKAAAPAPLPPGERPKGTAQWQRSLTPDPVLLFRYSALTYNAHRIHYDRPYTVEQEMYPGLVVHGPLLGTLLLELALEKMKAASITRYTFRASRPTFDARPLTVCAAREDGGATLWTVDDGGFVGMSARAEGEFN